MARSRRGLERMNVRGTLTNPFEHVFKLLLFFRSDILEGPFDQSRQGRLIERWLWSGPPRSRREIDPPEERVPR